MKMMIDSQIYDLVANTPGLAESLNALQRGGALTILSTHIQEDELASIKDAGKAARYAAFAVGQVERCELALSVGEQLKVQDERLMEIEREP